MTKIIFDVPYLENEHNNHPLFLFLPFCQKLIFTLLYGKF